MNARLAKVGVFFFLLTWFPQTGLADSDSKIDYNVALEASYPLGGGLSGWLGYNWLLWGQKNRENVLIGEKGGERWMYGYLRPHARLFTNYFYNRAELRFDLYPISIAGLTFGSVVTHRNRNKGGFNCNVVSCKGLLYRHFVEANVKVGYWKLFLTWTGRMDLLRSSENRTSFVDEASSLEGRGKSDELFRSTVNFGGNITDEWRVSTLYNYETMRITNATGKTYGLSVRYRLSDQWQFTVTGTTSSTPTDSRGYSGTLRVSWVPEPSFAL